MTLNPAEIPTRLTKVVWHFLHMHRWQKALLACSMVLFGSGAAHQMMSYIGQPTPPAAVSSDGTVADQSEPPAQKQTMGQKLSPWAMRVGASFIVGFLLGFGLRVFVRTTATILAIGAAILMLLSRFHVMNLDFSKAEVEYKSSIHWAQVQAEHIKDDVVSHLPSSGSAATGVLAGFRRKRLRP